MSKKDYYLLGKWGKERWDYLMQWDETCFIDLDVNGKLNIHINEIQKQADELEQQLLRELDEEVFKDDASIKKAHEKIEEIVRKKYIYPLLEMDDPIFNDNNEI